MRRPPRSCPTGHALSHRDPAPPCLSRVGWICLTLPSSAHRPSGLAPPYPSLALPSSVHRAPGLAPPYPGRVHRPSASPYLAARAGRPTWPRSAPAVAHKATRRPLASPHLAVLAGRPAGPYPAPAVPRPAARVDGPIRPRPAVLRPAPPCLAHRVGGPSPPAPTPPVRAKLLFVLIVFPD
jgi:hypothetical protein